MYTNDSSSVRQEVIVSNAYGDVNGDGILDYVFLTAVKSQDPTSPYVEDITLNIQDGRTNNVYSVPLDEHGNAGYQPTVFLGDFTGDGVTDMLISIDSGGSGAITFNYIYTFVHNQPRKLFDFNQYNKQNQYKVTYLDQYKVRVKSTETDNSFLITIQNRSADYLSQIYHEDGTLKEPTYGMADGISGFYPVDMDRDGIYEVQAFQQMSGLYHADSFGYIINTLKWDGRKFAIWQQWFASLPD